MGGISIVQLKLGIFARKIQPAITKSYMIKTLKWTI